MRCAIVVAPAPRLEELGPYVSLRHELPLRAKRIGDATGDDLGGDERAHLGNVGVDDVVPRAVHELAPVDRSTSSSIAAATLAVASA